MCIVAAYASMPTTLAPTSKCSIDIDVAGAFRIVLRIIIRRKFDRSEFHCRIEMSHKT